MLDRTSLRGVPAGLVMAALTGNALGQEISFSPPAFLPGDAEIGAAAGMQVEMDIARGGSQYLVVWSDGRTTPDDYYPFATEGSGTDIYGALLDAGGNLVGGPIVINQDLGDQIEPQVAWNGDSWLVAWRQPTVTLPTYERVAAARIAADGTVLDAEPIVVFDDDSFLSSTPAVEGGAGAWVVLLQAEGPTDGLFAVRVDGDGTVSNPGGLLLHGTFFLLDFDLAFAGDEYLMTWGGAFDTPRGRRFTPGLSPIGGTFPLPFVEKVASDGTDFLVTWASGPPPLATVDAVLVTHDGMLPNQPMTIFTAGGQAGTCCANATWDGTNYWVSWGQNFLARVTADGHLLDPGGFQTTMPGATPMSTPLFAGVPDGGLQMTWSDGVNGADYPKDVHTARIDAAGVLDNETLVSTGAPAQLDADLAAGDGVHLVVFDSRVSGAARILAQRLDAAGTPLDAEPIEVASGPMPGIGLPSIGPPAAAWNGSNFLITWSDGLQILARRLLPDGTFLDPSPLTVMDGREPDVAALGGDFLVVGLDFLQGNPQWQATHSMRVDGATGQNLDAEPLAIGGFVIFARHPHVVSFGGRWLATWQTNASHDEPNASVRGAFIEADGTAPGGVFFVSFGGWRPDVAVSGDEALFVWSNGSIASADSNIMGRRMLPDGTFPAGEFIVAAAPDRQLYPAVTWTGSQFLAAWQDKRNSVIYFDERTDIYGARVSADGVLLDLVSFPIAASPMPEVWPSLTSSGGTTILAASTFRPDADLGAYRVGIQADGIVPVTGDLDGDGDVDVVDMLALLAAWGPCGGCPADLDGDGTVGVTDFLDLLANWT